MCRNPTSWWMELGGGVFGRCFGLDEVMRVVFSRWDTCPSETRRSKGFLSVHTPRRTMWRSGQEENPHQEPDLAGTLVLNLQICDTFLQLKLLSLWHSITTAWTKADLEAQSDSGWMLWDRNTIGWCVFQLGHISRQRPSCLFSCDAKTDLWEFPMPGQMRQPHHTLTLPLNAAEGNLGRIHVAAIFRFWKVNHDTPTGEEDQNLNYDWNSGEFTFFSLLSESQETGTDLDLVSTPKTVRTPLRDHCPGPRLTTGRCRHRTHPRSTGKIIWNQPQLQPTEGCQELVALWPDPRRSSVTKTKI